MVPGTAPHRDGCQEPQDAQQLWQADCLRRLCAVEGAATLATCMYDATAADALRLPFRSTSSSSRTSSPFPKTRSRCTLCTRMSRRNGVSRRCQYRPTASRAGKPCPSSESTPCLVDSCTRADHVSLLPTTDGAASATRPCRISPASQAASSFTRRALSVATRQKRVHSPWLRRLWLCKSNPRIGTKGLRCAVQCDPRPGHMLQQRIPPPYSEEAIAPHS